MSWKHHLVAIAALTSPAPALAHDYLTSVTSQVFQAQGTPREIASRANICMSQLLASGMVSAPLMVSSDLEGGVIVAQSALEYSDTLVKWKVRSTFTFEARDGRFRILQTNLQRFDDTFGNGWTGIGKWAGSGWKKAEAAFGSSADAVAACVVAGPKKGDW
jgi:hypothetical protein